ncbi:MAG: TetR/AcrR family transcriptional regulator C-terminal domain-containing protein [Lachnospiraceae bacterium]|nr:TetR/AcrR family transcriptional regulator C-terminal domain-containing protein [Lachnospiraceae bacterium]
MQAKESVDQLLADAFKELVLSMPIEKITIKKITDKAGVIRPTFYNHFQDKYELLEWIIREQIISPASALLSTGYVKEAFLVIFNNVYEDRGFYAKAARLEGQNSFQSIIQLCIREVLVDEFEKNHIDLPQKKWLTIERLADYYAFSLSYIVINWIKSNYLVSPEELVLVCQYILSHSLEDLLNDSGIR